MPEEMVAPMHGKDSPQRKSGLIGLAMALFLCSGLAASVLSPEVCRAETAIIDVQYRPAQELLPIVESVLSGEGRVTAHTPTNSLVVTGRPETIRQVREVLARLDKPIQQVTVRVRFEEEGRQKDRAVSADVTVSGDDWRVSTGGRQEDGVDVRLRDESRRRTQSGETSVTVMSGTEAYIAVGEDLPVTDRWHHICRRYRGPCDDTAFRRMETGLRWFPSFGKNMPSFRSRP